MDKEKNSLSAPVSRKLKGYAFDPSLSLKPETAKINMVEYLVPWEDLEAGPIGEYIEVIDFDPTTKTFYTPVDLNHQYILADNGLQPSESNPHFHQQMVYSVAMITIKNFESALGRKIIWSPRLLKDQKKYEEYVGKLRIYPHALRDANAYYSPNKKALLFGYFTSSPSDTTQHLPGSLVFTCLSHDIIAHETTHAILDGMQRYYNEPTNPDVLAFHEAFSDIVALFQHFTFPEVIAHQISKTKGDLSAENHLVKLAHEFGAAIGHYGGLRDAIGEYDEEKGEWRNKIPDPMDYQRTLEPHARGSILVAAVFEAFIQIYNSRIADLKRIATDGTGILPRGELHPDLVNRLADEATKTAKHVLHMCIRALDYCPPVDITFGDFLRAIITGDVDIVKEDNYGYRLCFIEAFRKRGIYPKDIRTLSVDSLSYSRLPIMDMNEHTMNKIISESLRSYMNEIIFEKDREKIYEISKKYISGVYDKRRKIYGLHRRLNNKFEDSEIFSEKTGVYLMQYNWDQFGINDSNAYKELGPSFQVQNLRLVSRIGPDGQSVNQIVFSLVQRAGVLIKNNEVVGCFQPDTSFEPKQGEEKMEFRGGCTLIYDLDNLELKYIISKPLIVKKDNYGNFEINKERVLEQYGFLFEQSENAINEFQKYFNMGLNNKFTEPFYILHQ